MFALSHTRRSDEYTIRRAAQHSSKINANCRGEVPAPYEGTRSLRAHLWFRFRSQTNPGATPQQKIGEDESIALHDLTGHNRNFLAEHWPRAHESMELAIFAARIDAWGKIREQRAIETASGSDRSSGVPWTTFHGCNAVDVGGAPTRRTGVAAPPLGLCQEA